MTLNRLKKIWDNGEYALNGWLSINNSFIAEIMSRQNYDTLTIDMQQKRFITKSFKLSNQEKMKKCMKKI